MWWIHLWKAQEALFSHHFWSTDDNLVVEQRFNFFPPPHCWHCKSCLSWALLLCLWSSGELTCVTVVCSCDDSFKSCMCFSRRGAHSVPLPVRCQIPLPLRAMALCLWPMPRQRKSRPDCLDTCVSYTHTHTCTGLVSPLLSPVIFWISLSIPIVYFPFRILDENPGNSALFLGSHRLYSIHICPNLISNQSKILLVCVLLFVIFFCFFCQRKPAVFLIFLFFLFLWQLFGRDLSAIYSFFQKAFMYLLLFFIFMISVM